MLGSMQANWKLISLKKLCREEDPIIHETEDRALEAIECSKRFDYDKISFVTK